MKNQYGFSLIELMVAIGVFAILASIATPGVLSWMDNARVSSASRQVMSAIQDARMHAVKENSTARIEFSETGDSYVTRKWNRGTNTWNVQTHDLPPGVQMNNNFSGSQFAYNSRGLPINPNTRAFANGTVSLNNGTGTTVRVVVNAMGNVRIEN